MERYGHLPYYQVPADVLDSPEVLETWVDKQQA
jgi:TfoX/Sxy family transcriptional regulator of competence genes